MATLWLLEKSKVWKKLMENNIRSLSDLQTVLLLETPLSLAHMSVEVLQLKSKYQFIKNSTLWRRVCHILIPLNLNKCPSAAGKNSVILNNCMLSWTDYSISGLSTSDFLKTCTKKMQKNSLNSPKIGKVIKLMNKVSNLKLSKSMKSLLTTSHYLLRLKSVPYAPSGEVSSLKKSSSSPESTAH